MIDPDIQLVDRIHKGDRTAMELLYRRYVDRVWRYGWSVTRSRDMAAEIVQETFLRVIRSLGGFQRRSMFSTWLFTLTRSATLELLRRRRMEDRARECARILRLVQPSEEDRSTLKESDSEIDIRRAVGELPAAQRDAVVLCEWLGMSIKDAAEVLHWGESRVKVTLFRARRALREMLARELTSSTEGMRSD